MKEPSKTSKISDQDQENPLHSMVVKVLIGDTVKIYSKTLRDINSIQRFARGIPIIGKKDSLDSIEMLTISIKKMEVNEESPFEKESKLSWVH